MHFMRRHVTLLSIGFITGFVVIAMEISASRLSAPYFGTSIFVWSDIIAVVLLCLSIGYYLGGVLSEKHPSLNYLLRIILIAGIIFFFVPMVSGTLAGTLGMGSVLVPAFLFTFILFGLPLVLLAMVSPFILKLYTEGNTHVGNASGLLSAWSTLGSLLGTFIPTLWLIPTFGTRFTLHILSAVLIVVGVFGFKKKVAVGLALVVIAGFGIANFLPVSTAYGSSYEKETPYSFITVTKDLSENVSMRFDRGGGIQSIYNPNKVLTGYYYDYLAALAGRNVNNPSSVLVVGMAGGTTARVIKKIFGDGISIDGVEIDLEVTKIAKEKFGLDGLNINFIESDGRTYVKKTSNMYDYIIVDAYQNEDTIPWTLTTKEFWAEVKEKLTADGYTAMNISTEGSTRLLEAIANSQASVFPYTYIVRQTETSSMIISSKEPFDFAGLAKKLANSELAKVGESITEKVKPFTYNSQKMVLTDDKAPVEFLSE